MAGTKRPDCRTPERHRPDEPGGFVAWTEWAEQMDKTHTQRRCPGCGLFAVWVPRKREADI